MRVARGAAARAEGIVQRLKEEGGQGLQRDGPTKGAGCITTCCRAAA
jgi:hypothetical protein